MADKHKRGPGDEEEDEVEVPPTERLTKGEGSAAGGTSAADTVVAFKGGSSSAKEGDAKIEMGTAAGTSASSAHSGLVGMTKKELMRYANDPFWIRLRRGLFVLFWVVWFGMLFASIFIIWDAMAHGACKGSVAKNGVNSTVASLVSSDADAVSSSDGSGAPSAR